jgi:glycosyltransferase involved in cell wall biosynthesis
MNLKYSLVLSGKTTPQSIIDALGEMPRRSGLFNWIFAHKGEINQWNDIKHCVDDYDVIQVNMSPMDMTIIPEIRNTISDSTKLVINNDYVCEYWNKWNLHPHYYRDIQMMGDMVFGTEPHQVSNMINGAFCMPHPTHTKILKSFGHDVTQEENSVGFIYHWWAPEAYLSYMTLEAVKAKFGVEKSRIYGYSPDKDPLKSFVQKKMLFDDVMHLTDFPTFADKIQKERCLYDPNPCHTYGRNGVEAACLGVPIVGSDRVFSQQKLFPTLACDPYDKCATIDRFKTVFCDESEMKKIMDYAYREVEFFNYENSVKRYIDALKEADERGGHKWYQKNG